MKTVKVGILGAGFVANTFHMPSFQEIEGAEVVAAFSHRREVVDEFGKRWRIPRTYHGDDGISKLCSDPEVELVDIALPNHLHLTATLAAAENHKSIVCEKPFARNEQEAKNMLDIVSKHGVPHFYAENQVFIPQIVRTKELIERGVIGQVFWVRCREANLAQHSSWFWDPSASGGGAMLDLGAHTVEVGRHLLGKKPVSVLGWASRLIHSTIAEDNAMILVRFDGSELLQTENSWVTRGGFDFRVEVYGGNGSLFSTISREAGISLFTSEGSSKLMGRGEGIMERAETKKGRVFPALGEHRTLGFVDEFKHFLSALSTDQRALETFEDGYLVSRILGAAYRSSKTDSWESL